MLRVMCGRLCALAALVTVGAAAGAAAGQSVITQWDFNAGSDANTSTGTLTPSTGMGTAGTFGGITVSYGSGDASGGSSDPNVGDDSAWQTTGYPAQGIGSGTAGVEFAASTAGFGSIMIGFDQRHSNTSSRFVQVFISTNGTTFTPVGAPFDAASGGDTWYNGRVVDLSSIPAAGNNPNFKFRLAPVFAPATSQYTASTATSTYAGTGTNRFDVVTISGAAVASIPPSGTGAAEPDAVCFGGGQVLLTVAAASGFNPGSTSLAVAANLASVGGPAVQSLFDDGTHGDAAPGDGLFSLLYTVPASVAVGVKSVPATISDQVPGRTGAAAIGFTVADCSTNSPSRVVISQVYGGGGNLGPPAGVFNADFVELYNRSGQVVDLTGWSVQYAGPNATGGFDGPNDRALLSGVIRPGQHLLVRFSEVDVNGAPLPPADFAAPVGGMGNNGGRIALVRTPGLILANCADANIEDLVGYGGAQCFEGAGAAPVTANDTGAARKAGGAQDRNQNFNDFVVQTPAPLNRGAGGFLAGYGSVEPGVVCAGSAVAISVQVVAGASPASSNIQVNADLSTLGGPAVRPLAAAGGGLYTTSFTVPAGAAQGGRTIAVSVTDAQGRTDGSSVAVTVANCANSASRVVISQVYGGGGNAGSVFNADFIELFNRSAAAVSLAGWSVQYAAAAGDFLLSQKIDLAGTIAPGAYRLVRTNVESAVNGLPIPAADFTPATAFGMDNQFAKVALVRTTNPLGPACTRVDVEDFLGYGASAGCFEGVAPTATLDNTLAATRADGGCRDTDQSRLDFVVATPSALPRSGASPASPCAASPAGACCSGATCALSAQGSCAGANTGFAGAGTACNAAGNSASPCCKADYNHVGGVTVQDIFDFLAGYFGQSPQADVNGGGVTVQDIFDYLSAYFSGPC